MEVDIREYSKTLAVVQGLQPQVVFHLAAQALVLEGYEQPLMTFATNVMGTAHLLEALRAGWQRALLCGGHQRQVLCRFGACAYGD